MRPYYGFNHAFKLFYRNFSSNVENTFLVKVVADEKCIKFFFQYFDRFFQLERPTHEKLKETLTCIKISTESHLKKRELLRSFSFFIRDRCNQTGTSKLINVSLMKNDSVIDGNMPNIKAWSQASVMNIGDIVYEVCYNVPTVKNLMLPHLILAGCAVTPHYLFECASQDESIFTWYRSVLSSSNRLMSDNILMESGRCWEKIHEGCIYFTCTEDVGCYLKVVCTPKKDGRSGIEISTESKAVVETAFDEFPFERRQESTKTFCEDSSIRCVTYNVLSKMFLDDDKFPYSTNRARDADYRKQILLKELVGYKSDIICLQEVEFTLFEKYLDPILNLKGYSGYYTRKGEQMYDGAATFFRTSKFRFKRKYDVLLKKIVREQHIYGELFSKVGGNLKDMNKLFKQRTVLQLLLLEHINQPGNELLVANTHLYSNKDSPEVRLIQSAACLEVIKYTIHRRQMQSPGIIFCGDFNSLPNSPAYEFLMSGKYECCENWSKSSDTNGNTVLEHSLDLDSACGTPEYTNYTTEFKGCLDYIFYSKDTLEVTDVVPMPKHEDVIAQEALPSEYFPSDHIPLICTLIWKKS